METDKRILTILLKDIATTRTATSLSKQIGMSRCKEAISQCEEIVFSDTKFDIPQELIR